MPKMIQSPNAIEYQLFGLDVVRGLVRGRNSSQYKFIRKFGHNHDVDNILEDIILWGGTYPTIGTTQNLIVSSSSVSDTHTVAIEYLDANYDLASTTVTLTGTTPVATGIQFKNVHRMYNNSGTNTVGTVTAYGTDGVTIYAQYEGEEQQTAQLHYVIPRNFNGYLLKTSAWLNKGSGTGSADISVMYKPFNGVWREQLQIAVSSTANSGFVHDWFFPMKFEQKSEIKMSAIGNSGAFNGDIAGEFCLLLVPTEDE